MAIRIRHKDLVQVDVKDADDLIVDIPAAGLIFTRVPNSLESLVEDGILITEFVSDAQLPGGVPQNPPLLSGSATLDFPSIVAGANADLTITVTGAIAGDAVYLGLPTAPLAGLIFSAWVSAADTVTVRAENTAALARNQAPGIFKASVIRI